MIRQERETMGQYMLSGTSIISAAGDNVTIRFPKKKDAFLFQPPARSGCEIEEPKDWEFKRF
jgi:hypothetical protein